MPSNSEQFRDIVHDAPFLLVAALLLLSGAAGCGLVETISSDTSSEAISVTCDDYDRLWNATLNVVGRHYGIVEQDKQRGIIIARRKPADRLSYESRTRAYPDASNTVIRIRITGDGETYRLKVVAVQQPEFPSDSHMRPYANDRSTHVREPHYMGRYDEAEQFILREVRAELAER